MGKMMKTVWFNCCLLILCLCFCFSECKGIPLSGLQDESIVETESGLVRGLVGETFRSFLGIPYISPPVGSLRWKAPSPVTPWKPSIYDATSFKPGCPQECILPQGACPAQQSEDCIYLNIFTPRLSKLKSQPQPVMVFLPGGHFEQGSAGVELYNGTYFVNRTNVILVTVGYRLGALGWIADMKKGINGNYGFLDQREALKWVQRNIHQFGGDRNSVTLFGQSAGASCASAHLISPGSANLFHRVIIQSNPFTLHMRSLSDASNLGDTFSKILGCDTFECLQSRSVDEIVKAQYESAKKFPFYSPLTKFLPWTPTVDGKEIFQQTLDAFKQGNYSKMPMILGSLTEEAYLFIFQAVQKPVNELEYLGVLAAIFGTKSIAVDKLYPGRESPLGDRREQLSVLGTDYIFTAPTRNATLNIARHNGDQGVYIYYFNHSLSFDCWEPSFPFCRGHSCHGSDIPVVFHTPDAASQWTKEEEELSNLMIDYWTNFARTGDPNQGRAKVSTEWPLFDTNLKHMEFMTPKSRSGQAWKEKYCDFFDQIGYHWGWKDKNH